MTGIDVTTAEGREELRRLHEQAYGPRQPGQQTIGTGALLLLDIATRGALVPLLDHIDRLEAELAAIKADPSIGKFELAEPWPQTEDY